MPIDPSAAIAGKMQSLDIFKIFDKVDSSAHKSDRIIIKDQQGQITAECRKSDTPGVNERVNGHAKVASFHIFNFMTLGLVGYVGKLCSESSAMGSTKSEESQSWLVKAVKDYGQTYRNATEHSGGFINKATKIWSHDLATATGVDALRNFFSNRESAQILHQVVKHDLGMSPSLLRNCLAGHQASQGQVGAMKTDFYQRLAGELGLQDDPWKSIPAKDILNGSDALKQAYLHFTEETFCSENTLFSFWSSEIFGGPSTLPDDTFDPGSEHFDGSLSASKSELYMASKDFIPDTGKYGINVRSQARAHISADLRAVFQQATQLETQINQQESRLQVLKNQLKYQERRLESEGGLSQGLSVSTGDGDTQSRIDQLKSQIASIQDNLSDLKQQLATELSGDITCADNPRLFQHLHACHAEIIQVQNDTSPRFAAYVKEQAGISSSES